VIPPQPKLPKFLSMVEGRKPKQKAHNELRFAKASMRESLYGFYPNPELSSRTATVYELVDGEWKLLWDIPKGTPKTELPWLQ